jgi:hypothetical protein
MKAEGRDPWRSLVKAAAVVRREANRIMVALYEGGLEAVLRSIVRCMGSGCQIERRKGHPSTAQLLLEGLDWHLTLTSCLWGQPFGCPAAPCRISMCLFPHRHDRSGLGQQFGPEDSIELLPGQ